MCLYVCVCVGGGGGGGVGGRAGGYGGESIDFCCSCIVLFLSLNCFVIFRTLF